MDDIIKQLNKEINSVQLLNTPIILGKIKEVIKKHNSDKSCQIMRMQIGDIHIHTGTGYTVLSLCKNSTILWIRQKDWVNGRNLMSIKVPIDTISEIKIKKHPGGRDMYIKMKESQSWT